MVSLIQSLKNLLDEQLFNAWNDLYSVTDSFTDGWLSAGKFSLSLSLSLSHACVHALAHTFFLSFLD
jgi:hypothetical protein